jgi:hypothetical protein
MKNLKELNSTELIDIEAGAPGKNTSFVYDVMWSIGRGVRAVDDWFMSFHNNTGGGGGW